MSVRNSRVPSLNLPPNQSRSLKSLNRQNGQNMQNMQNGRTIRNRVSRGLLRSIGSLPSYNITTTRQVENMTLKDLREIDPYRIRFRNINIDSLENNKKILMNLYKNYKHSQGTRTHLNQLHRNYNKEFLSRSKKNSLGTLKKTLMVGNLVAGKNKVDKITMTPEQKIRVREFMINLMGNEKRPLTAEEKKRLAAYAQIIVKENAARNSRS
jgi:hypothetical protein